jgi:hypothetical protein
MNRQRDWIRKRAKEREIHLNFVGGSHTAEAVKEIVSEYPSVIRAEQKDSLLYIWSEKPEEAFFIGQ